MDGSFYTVKITFKINWLTRINKDKIRYLIGEHIMHTQEQYNNLALIYKMLCELDPDKFDGGGFDHTSSIRDGCAIHHAYHNGFLPTSVVLAIRRYGNSFWANENKELIEDAFGNGAWKLFLDEDSDFDIDHVKFLAALLKFMGESPTSEQVNDSEISEKSYRIFKGKESSSLVELEEARRFVKIAEELGVRDLRIMQFETVKVYSYSVKSSVIV